MPDKILVTQAFPSSMSLSYPLLTVVLASDLFSTWLNPFSEFDPKECELKDLHNYP